MRPITVLRFKFDCLFAIIALCTFLAGCGGPRISEPAPPLNVTVIIDPLHITVEQGFTFTFTAKVTGASDTAVTWSIREGSAGGSITGNGVYTAPNSAGWFHVVATSLADPAKTATAQIIVTQVAIGIFPATDTLAVNTTVVLSGDISGTVNSSVSWAVQESDGGTIAPDASDTTYATYTAPETPGTYHVVATSLADPTKSATATITVTPPVLSIAPLSEILGPEGTRQFSASIAGLTDQTVTWSVEEGSAGGSVDSNGLYTASASLGTYHIVATSVVDSTVTATANITVVARGFKPVGPMVEARELPTATVLGDGRVLIAGGAKGSSRHCDPETGWNCPSLLATAEIFDPTSNSFSSTGSMADQRVGHTATQLQDGRVLIVGGYHYNASLCNSPGWEPLASAEIYDPVSETFSPTEPMAVGRAFQTATRLPDGRVLIAGGFAADGCQNGHEIIVPTDSAEIFDPASGAFTNAGLLVDGPRAEHVAVLLGNDTVLLVGGVRNTPTDFDGLGDYTNVTTSTEIFDPSSTSFRPAASMTDFRANFSAATLADGRVLVEGGYEGDVCDDYDGSSCWPQYLETAEVYDTASGKFQATGAMNTVRENQVSVSLSDGTVLVSGGDVDDRNYDPASSGIDLSRLSSVELFEPSSGSFVLSGSLQYEVTRQAGVRLNDGRVLVVGGSDSAGNAVRLAEVFQ